MQENQNVEWKLIWKKEYLKWICAFANTTGGVLYIGKDDKGKIVGVNNAKELVYTIPHVVKDYLGIIVETSIKRKKNLEIIRIIVPAHAYPVSLRGRYYLRSGSNTYEATGVELDRLLLKKMGIRFEQTEIAHSSISDLDNYTIDYFKDLARKSNRLTEKEINVPNEILLRNLRLLNNTHLTRAGILLFSKTPEEFIEGSYIKIGFFNKDNTIIEEKEIHGPLIIQLEDTLNVILNHLTSLSVNKNGIIKNELLTTRTILKETIINAIEHKTYDKYNPIQIKVYEDKIVIWNPGEFNNEINLYAPHASMPYNPNISYTFYKSGLVSSWGLGFEKIKDSSKANNLPYPKYIISDNNFTIILRPSKEYLTSLKETLIKKENLSNQKETLLKQIMEDESITEEDIKRFLKLIPR